MIHVTNPEEHFSMAGRALLESDSCVPLTVACIEPPLVLLFNEKFPDLSAPIPPLSRF